MVKKSNYFCQNKIPVGYMNKNGNTVCMRNKTKITVYQLLLPPSKLSLKVEGIDKP